MKEKITTLSTMAARTETIVIDGVSIRINFSDKRDNSVLDDIKKTLLKTAHSSKKIA